ncbi:MAG TPA: class I SAM-dependent methyltransferase [Microbacteriaceae bacterium]|nr:class I SAM-dependent methyltransferase [Microbacteriaceae bacterium]
MSDHDRNWKFVDESVELTPASTSARTAAAEHGLEPVSPAIAAQLTLLVAARRAKAIIEIGTGTGVSGLALLAGGADSHLTTIDLEPEHQAAARNAFAEAGIAPTRVRFINGRASEVLPRMNESAYDVVLVDADAENALEYVEHGLRLTTPGGLVLVHRALQGTANPADRSETATTMRALVAELEASSAVVTAVSPAGGGLLQIVKLA